MRRWLLLVFLIGVGVVLYALNYFTPMASDDWNYVFVFGTDERIQSLWDVVKSQYYHYHDWNGRVVAQSMAQIIDSFLPKQAENLLNTLVFFVFLWAIGINVPRERKRLFQVIASAFVLIFLLLPEFNMTCLWITGASNYLYVASLMLLFHYMLENRSFKSWAVMPLLFLFGVICGWTNEAFVVGMAGAYLLYYILHKQELTTHKAVMLAGFFIGALFLVFSPGSWQRAMEDVQIHSKRDMLGVLISMDNLRLLPLTIIVLPLLAVFKQIKLGAFLKQELWLVLAIIFTFAFVLLTTHQTGHSRMGIELFSLILLFRALPWHRISGVAVGVATVAALVVGIFAVAASRRCYLVNENEFAQIRQHKFPIATTIPKYHPWLNRYIVPYSFSILGNDFKHYGQDSFISKYYGNDSIYFLPEAFVRAVQENPGRFDSFQTETSWPFYAKREENDSDKTMDYAMLEYAPYDYSKLNWPFSVVAPLLQEYSIQEMPAKIQRVMLDSTNYIIAEKDPVKDFRLLRITLRRIAD
jgi:hypothetical protein